MTGLAEDEDPSLSYEALLELDRNNVRRGLTQAEKSKLQRVRATASHAKLECPISREKFKVGEVMVKLPCNCNGVYFKQAAIDTWLESHRTCPVCRWEFPG